LDEALSSQRRVASSLQPGTAKCARGFTSALGRSVAGWRGSCVRACRAGAALAAVQRAIIRQMAKRERIVWGPIEGLTRLM